MSQNTELSPVDAATDNISGDILDSMMSGVAAHMIVSVLMGKSPSVKNVLTTDSIKTGIKYGAGVALYRRVGRPMLNNAMERGGVGNMYKL